MLVTQHQQRYYIFQTYMLRQEFLSDRFQMRQPILIRNAHDVTRQLRGQLDLVRVKILNHR